MLVAAASVAVVAGAVVVAAVAEAFPRACAPALLPLLACLAVFRWALAVIQVASLALRGQRGKRQGRGLLADTV